MATAPNLVVAGDAGLAWKLWNTGRFPAVFGVASAAELRGLSKSGRVSTPAAFVFAPDFGEDVPGAEVSVLANGLAASGFTVLVHAFFTERGDVFDPGVVATAAPMTMSELLARLGVVQPDPQPPQEPWAAPPDLHPEPPADPWTAPG